MSISASPCISYLAEIQQGIHRPNHVYKLALYAASATLSERTTTYSAAHEMPQRDKDGTLTNYPVGGLALSGFDVDEDACLYFDDVTFKNATLHEPAGGLIYNSSVGDRACFVVKFTDKERSYLGAFLVQLPAPLHRLRPAK